MCGILGTIPKTEKNFFKKALDTLKHRGPDDYGVETIKDTITLGHRRLSIIDHLKLINLCLTIPKDIILFLMERFITF